MLRAIQTSQPGSWQIIGKFENELESLFEDYHQKLDELKQLIQKYQEKEKSIRNEIKKCRKQIFFSEKMQYDTSDNGKTK